MRDITKLPSEFDLSTVKRAYRVNSQKAQKIIDEFVKNGLVEFKNGRYVKIEKDNTSVTVEDKPVENNSVEEKQQQEQETKDENKNEKIEEKQAKSTKKETKKSIKKSIKDEVVDSNIPIPYEVTTDKGTFVLNVSNFDELKVVVDRVTGYSGAVIKDIKRLR